MTKDPPEGLALHRPLMTPFSALCAPPRETEPASLATRMRVPGDSHSPMQCGPWDTETLPKCQGLCQFTDLGVKWFHLHK